MASIYESFLNTESLNERATHFNSYLYFRWRQSSLVMCSLCSSSASHSPSSIKRMIAHRVPTAPPPLCIYKNYERTIYVSVLFIHSDNLLRCCNNCTCKFCNFCIYKPLISIMFFLGGGGV